MESEPLNEMPKIEQKLKFENFLAEQATISAQFMETRIKERVHELVQEFRHESSNTIQNIFADLLSAGAFSWLLLISKREIAILKDFIDQIICGLSDTGGSQMYKLPSDWKSGATQTKPVNKACLRRL